MSIIVTELGPHLRPIVDLRLKAENLLKVSKYRVRLTVCAVVAGSLAPVSAAGQICAGLPAEVSQVVSVAMGSRSDKPPMTDLQYVGASYANVVGDRLTMMAFGQVPVPGADPGFLRAAAELTAALPGTIGAGCPVITAGYSAQRGVRDAGPHLSMGYGVGRRWNHSEGDGWFAFYAIPGVLVDRHRDYLDGGSSTRIRFASDLGFLISLNAHLYIGGGLRRAFLDGGGTSLEAKVGWTF